MPKSPQPISLPSNAATREAPPYGAIGLILSLVVIGILAAVLSLVMAAAGFGVVALLHGWQEALDRFIALDPSGGRNEPFVAKLSIVVSLMLYAATSAAILIAARVRGGPGWRELIAWRSWSPVRGARFFWSLAVLVLLYSLGADAAIAHLYPTFQDLVHMPKEAKWVALFVILASVFAPITEELLFRGWLYTSLRLAIGVPAGIIVTAVLFALAHWESTHLYALAVFPVGLALGYLRERTGSIKATMTFHAIYNGIASVLLFFAR